MTSTLIQLSEDEFDDQYPLVRNHLNPNASWSDDDGPGGSPGAVAMSGSAQSGVVRTGTG